MATINGNAVLSSFHGGWRIYVDYTVVANNATTYAIRVNRVEAAAVVEIGNHSCTLFNTSVSDVYGTQTVAVSGTGQTSQSTTARPTQVWVGEDQNLMRWRWTFNKTMTWQRGHVAQSKTVTIKAVLSGYSLYYDWDGTMVNTSGTSTATLSIDLPALDSWQVSLDNNGGTGDTSATKWYGEALTLPSPARAGYAFSGWALPSAPATVVYEPGDSYTANEPASLVAVWTPIISGVTITSLTAVRADNEGNPAEDGVCAIIECAWMVTGAKAATVDITARLDTQPGWTDTDTGTKTSADLTGTSSWFVSDGRVSAGGRYTASVTVACDGVSASMSETIGIAFITIDVKAGGKGIAFGKASETDELFEVGNMDVWFERDLYVGGDANISGGASVSGDVTSAGTVSGAAVESAGPVYMYGIHLANCFSCSQVSATIGAVGGSSTKQLTIDASRTDYKPIAISGWYVYGAATLHPYMLRLNGTNVEVYLRNNLTTSTSASAVIYVQVLYIRTGGSSGSSTYDGAYVVTPRVYEQTLDTDGKKMLDDVTVEVIPVAEVSNEAGGKTATIGE